MAKSYQTLNQIGTPYLKDNGKMYVKVRTKAGAEKEVRWYNEDEYAKMYPGECAAGPHFNQEKILGFQNGYITIFKGNIEGNEEWFERCGATRYHVMWGWYVISTEAVPFDLPYDVEPVELRWDQVGLPNGDLRPEDQVRAVVSSLLYGAHPSTFQGQVGDRLDLVITVIKCDQVRNKFGAVSHHVFEDDNGNHYTWNTSAKCWGEGCRKHIKGTVKQHCVKNNIQITDLTRCAEVM